MSNRIVFNPTTGKFDLVGSGETIDSVSFTVIIDGGSPTTNYIEYQFVGSVPTAFILNGGIP
jgi:hypothetical protein